MRSGVSIWRTLFVIVVSLVAVVVSGRDQVFGEGGMWGGVWTVKTPMPTARFELAVGVVNGILYAVGGTCCAPGENATVLSTVEAYNPTTNAWTTKASMPTPRWSLAVGVAKGILYAVGGASPRLTNTVEAFDPIGNTWTTKAQMPTARFLHAVGVVNGIVYVVGGESVSKGGTPPNDWIVQFPRDLLAFKP